jgi:hypothetical protein
MMRKIKILNSHYAACSECIQCGGYAEGICKLLSKGELQGQEVIILDAGEGPVFTMDEISDHFKECDSQSQRDWLQFLAKKHREGKPCGK